MDTQNELQEFFDSLRRHLGQLGMILEGARSRWPQHSDLIDQQLSQYAEDVRDLSTRVWYSAPVLQPANLLQHYPLAPMNGVATDHLTCDNVGNWYSLDHRSWDQSTIQNGYVPFVTGPDLPLSGVAGSDFSTNGMRSFELTSVPRGHLSSSNMVPGQERLSLAENTEICQEPLAKKRKKKPCLVQVLNLAKSDRQFWLTLKTRIHSLIDFNDVRTPCDLESASSVFEKIEELEQKSQSYALQRRILLYHFFIHRKKVIERLQKRRAQPGTVLPTGTKKAESQALDQLVVQIYPWPCDIEREDDLEKWRKKRALDRKKIQNQLHSARNWAKAVDEFSLGILAFLPCSGEYGWQDSKFEKMNEEDCQELLDAWRDRQGTTSTAATLLSPLVGTVFSEEASFDTLSLQSQEVLRQIESIAMNRLPESIFEGQNTNT